MMMENQDGAMNQRENSENKLARHPAALKRWLVIAVVLLGAGAIAVTWLLTRGSSQGSVAGRLVPAPAGASVPAPPDAASTGTTPHPGEMVITLSPDKLENAKLKTEVVAEHTGMPSEGAAGIRTPGTAQS